MEEFTRDQEECLRRILKSLKFHGELITARSLATKAGMPEREADVAKWLDMEKKQCPREYEEDED